MVTINTSPAAAKLITEALRIGEIWFTKEIKLLIRLIVFFKGFEPENPIGLNLTGIQTHYLGELTKDFRCNINWNYYNELTTRLGIPNHCNYAKAVALDNYDFRKNVSNAAADRIQIAIEFIRSGGQLYDPESAEQWKTVLRSLLIPESAVKERTIIIGYCDMQQIINFCR